MEWTASKKLEQSFRKTDLEARAVKLLDLISAEFKSDPMSAQCFDSRVVSEVNALVEEFNSLPAFDKSFDGPPLKARTQPIGKFGYGENKSQNRYA